MTRRATSVLDASGKTGRPVGQAHTAGNSLNLLFLPQFYLPQQVELTKELTPGFLSVSPVSGL